VITAGYLESAAAAGGARALFGRLEGDKQTLYRTGLVARSQVRCLGSLGSAVDARTGGLVFPRHVYAGQSSI